MVDAKDTETDGLVGGRGTEGEDRPKRKKKKKKVRRWRYICSACLTRHAMSEGARVCPNQTVCISLASETMIVLSRRFTYPN